MQRKLKIDPKFRDLIPKLTAAEYLQLEKNILADGRIKEPIVVWNDTIIDGHHRYYIAQEHPEIPYEVEEREFPNEYAAMAWACANQLGRRSLNEYQRRYLISKQYDSEKMAAGGNRGNQYTKVAKLQNEVLPKSSNSTAAKVASESNVSKTTVERSFRFAKGLDVADEIQPGVKDEILQGNIDVSMEMIENLPKSSPEIQKEVVKTLSEKKKGSPDRAKQIKKILNPEPEPEPFNLDDLVQGIQAAAKNLHFALNQNLVVMHGDVIKSEDDKNKVISELQNINDDIQNFIENIRR